jgi:hypothetical protein
MVPPAVREELSRLGNSGAKCALEEAFAQGWLRAILLQEPVSTAIRSGLHSGEAESLALALEVRAAMIILDDGDARRRAVELGLEITGVLGILLKAKRTGQIPSLSDEIKRLRAEAHFFVAPALEKRLVAGAGESF